MPNSYSAVPNIIPGNVTVQGNLAATGTLSAAASSLGALTVTGNATASGNIVANGALVEAGTTTASSARHARLTFGAPGEALTFNLGADLATRDAGGTFADALVNDPVGLKFAMWRHLNAAGNGMDMALRLALLTDYVPHVHTGTVTADTIYSKLIRGGLIGANGAIKLTIALTPNVNGAGVTTLSFVFGGVSNTIFSANTLLDTTVEVWMANQNAQNAQRVVCRIFRSGQPVTYSIFTLAVDSSADQTMAIAIQNAATTDQQTFYFAEAELLNTFGPV